MISVFALASASTLIVANPAVNGEHRLSFAQEVGLASSKTDTRAGIGPAIGWTWSFRENWYTGIELGFWRYLGNSWRVGTRFGYELPGQWSPRIDAGISAHFGSGLEFLSSSSNARKYPMSFHGALGLNLLRFSLNQWSLSTCKTAVGLAIGQPARSVRVSLLMIERSL